MTRVSALLAFMLAGPVPLACGSAAPPPSERGPIQPSGVYIMPESASGSSHDAPEISRSAGTEGGIVVLWPRIVLPRGASGADQETRQVAARIQRRLTELAKGAAGNRPVDVRPEPERVCPKTGCRAVAVGALLARAGGGCAVVVSASPPGPSSAELVPWSGQIRLKANSVPFREPAEHFVSVTDYVPCTNVLTEPSSRDNDVAAAIQRSARVAR